MIAPGSPPSLSLPRKGGGDVGARSSHRLTKLAKYTPFTSLLAGEEGRGQGWGGQAPGMPT